MRLLHIGIAAVAAACGGGPMPELPALAGTAGCGIGARPGPSPHLTRCMQNHAGAFTCGGT
jgi:hypothetical protein